MTKEFEQYHGIVFTQLLHQAGRSVTVEFYPTKSNSSYVINNKAGLYIKHSAKRTSPWRFTFLQAHQNEIMEMYKHFGEVFVAFVCRDDGVAILNFSELKLVLDDNHADIEWICVARNRRTQYSVSGSDGKLDFKVSLKSCPDKILNYLDITSQKFEQLHTASGVPADHSSPSALEDICSG